MSTAKLMATPHDDGKICNKNSSSSAGMRRQSWTPPCIAIQSCCIGSSRGLVSTKPINAKAAAAGHALLKRSSFSDRPAKPAHKGAQLSQPQPPSFNLDVVFNHHQRLGPNPTLYHL